VGLVALLLTLTGAQSGSAREISGVTFAEESLVAGQPCRLTGIGLRKKFFVDVYLGALYLAKPTQDPKEVISSIQFKQVVLHVVYKQVEADKWVEGWKEGFEKNTPRPTPELKARMDQFMKLFDGPVMKGERVKISYVPDKGTEVMIKEQVRGTIPGLDFMMALWSVWFGAQPASEELKKGMLGL
jgi:hypothetical protein